MASGMKFQVFVSQKAAGTHAGFINANTAVVKAYLTNAAPNAATHTVKADIAEIAAGNGYTAGGAPVTNAATTTAGVIMVTAVDITWTASGGPIGPFRWVVLYNDTPTSPDDPLLHYYDYGSAVTLAAGESFTTDFGASLLTDQ